MPHVRYYELWNEMNIDLFWTGTQTDMVNLAKAAYPIVHADPHSMLLTPSVVDPVGDLSQASGDHLDGKLSRCGRRAIRRRRRVPRLHRGHRRQAVSDAGAGFDLRLHQVQRLYGSIVTKATMLRQVFDQHGLAGKPMFDTEGSWGDGNVTDPDTQAAWLARWYLLQAGFVLPTICKWWRGSPGATQRHFPGE